MLCLEYLQGAFGLFNIGRVVVVVMVEQVGKVVGVGREGGDWGFDVGLCFINYHGGLLNVVVFMKVVV